MFTRKRQSGFTLVELMIVVAITVALAVLGTTLAAMNTGVRISFAMAADKEMPEVLGLMHGKYATPHFGVYIMVAVSAILGAVGVVSVVNLTAITLASNLGTFILYGLICIWTILAFRGTKEYSGLKHLLIPALGLVMNIIMLIAIFALGIVSGGDSQTESYIAVGIAIAWAIISVLYFVWNSRRREVSITGAPITSSR